MVFHIAVLSYEGNPFEKTIVADYSHSGLSRKVAKRVKDFVTRRAENGLEDAKTLLERWNSPIVTPTDIITQYQIDSSHWDHPLLEVEYVGVADVESP